jgi:carbonic anhydrase
MNLRKFVELVNFNRRFTYQGSLTTAPLVEGILWNVIETVIPIKQHTMDQYTNFRKVAEEISTNYIVSAIRVEEMNQFKKAQQQFPDVVKCQYHEGNQFMRVAMCNRRVQDRNDRPVYHIDNTNNG